MAKAEFEGYKGRTDHIEYKEGKIADFVSKSGGPIDPSGDWEKKEKDAIDMNAGEAFNKKDYTKVEAMGTDYAKKGNYDQRCSNKGDHFSVGEVDPSGNDCGKSKSYQTTKRG